MPIILECRDVVRAASTPSPPRAPLKHYLYELMKVVREGVGVEKNEIN
jgi:hypothetical protein